MDAQLDSLVGEWLTVPDLAELVDLDVAKVRNLIRERAVVAVRRGERSVLSIPAAFVVPGRRGAHEVLRSLRGTLIVLADAGFDDVEAIRWLFTPDGSAEGSPLGALRAGHVADVRRRAQALAV